MRWGFWWARREERSHPLRLCCVDILWIIVDEERREGRLSSIKTVQRGADMCTFSVAPLIPLDEPCVRRQLRRVERRRGPPEADRDALEARSERPLYTSLAEHPGAVKERGAGELWERGEGHDGDLMTGSKELHEEWPELLLAPEPSSLQPERTSLNERLPGGAERREVGEARVEVLFGEGEVEIEAAQRSRGRCGCLRGSQGISQSLLTSGGPERLLARARGR